MSRISKTQQAEAIARLRELVKPGDTLHTISRHVSRSGMRRVIDLKLIRADGEVLHLGYNAALALGWSHDERHEGVKVSGGGMDMGFHLVYALGRTLFPDGFRCAGKDCPSNDHANGDRNYRRHKHTDGGYAVRQRWL